MSLGQDVSDKVEIISLDSKELKSVTATVENLPSKTAAKKADVTGNGYDKHDDDFVIEDDKEPEQGTLVLDDFSRAIKAKIVKKCGDREYWDRWAAGLRDIALAHLTRLEAILSVTDSPARQAFDAFLAEIRDDLNSGITEAEAVEMLAQHIITRPVFDALFEGHTFTEENPVSRAIQGVLDTLESAHLEKESRDLDEFYQSVRNKAQGITDPAAKQELVRQLYDNFFGVAFKGTRDKLGIVYTPIEIVDFIIRSVNDVLQDEFGQTLGSKGVHIIDPFTGTGTFITRLLQSGLIQPDELEHKFRYELYANEIVLLTLLRASSFPLVRYCSMVSAIVSPIFCSRTSCRRASFRSSTGSTPLLICSRVPLAASLAAARDTSGKPPSPMSRRLPFTVDRKIQDRPSPSLMRR